MIYDYIIVGAGIAGLYTAYNLKKTHPSCSFLILETNSKKYIGGRIHQEKFVDHLVTTGAGIGRKKKDKYLIKLLDELKVKYNEFKVKITYTFNPLDVKKTIKELQQIYENLPEQKNNESLTFKDFALPILGQEKYKQFLVSSGYTDYENDGIEEVLYMYGFEDNSCCWTGLSIPWNEFISKLIQNIGILNIKTNSYVTKIEDINNNICINVLNNHSNQHKYECKKLLIATTITSLRKLLKDPIYNEIEAQPFFRIYATISKKYIDIMKEKVKGMTIVTNELQKISPIDPEKGIYMVAYSDNKNAIKLKNYMKENIISEEKLYNLNKINYDNNEYLTQLLKKALDIKELKINKIVGFYRESGTHYYKPLNKMYNNRIDFIKKAQRPSKNIFVIGEVVSENQGWTNSALSTYHKIKNFL